MILPKSNIQNFVIKKFSTSYPHQYYGVNSPKYVTDFKGLKSRKKGNLELLSYNKTRFFIVVIFDTC